MNVLPESLSTTHTKANLGLPGYYYFDSEIFAREMRTLWRSTWQFVCRESDLPNPGDYLTCLVGNQPIFVIRTADGIQAMHNVCPHRGARLLDGQGNCAVSVRCPYHSWTFDLDGKLLGVPQQKRFPGLDKSSVHLLPVQVDSWGGFIFINPQLEGESLTSYLAGFTDYLKQYDQLWEELREVARWSYEESINWKFIVENYAEDYHFSTAHPQSLAFFNFQAIRTTTTGRHSQIYVPYTAEKPSESYQGLRWEPHSVSYQGYIFPNLMINTAKDHVSVFRLFPLNPVRTRLEVLIYQSPEQSKVSPYDEKFRLNFDQVMEEDFAVCRLLQANVHSDAYCVTQLAEERELGIAHFHEVLSEYLP